jgi:hypothetical protein
MALFRKRRNGKDKKDKDKFNADNSKKDDSNLAVDTKLETSKTETSKTETSKTETSKTEKTPTLKIDSSNLLQALLATKKGRVGNSEKKLRGDIAKNLAVREKDAFEKRNLLAYSKFREVRKELLKLKAKDLETVKPLEVKETQKKHEIPADADAEKINVPTTESSPSATESKGNLTTNPTGKENEIDIKREIFQDLLEIRKGITRNTEKKLKADIVKSLNVSPDEAFSAKNLLAYARLPEIHQLLEQLAVKRAKKQGLDKILRQQVDKGEGASNVKSSEKMDEYAMSEEQRNALEKRAAIVKKLMEERKKLLEQEADKEGKKEEKKAEKIKKKHRENPVGNGMGFLTGKIGKLFIVLLTIPLTLGRLIFKGFGGLFGKVYQHAGKFSPFGWKKNINQLIIYSGINKTQEEITGMAIVDGAVLGAVIAGAGFLFLEWSILVCIIAATIAFAMVWIVIYSIINLLADKRSDQVEQTLPDVLQIVSANISAGMTPYNALWVSARKEFGTLAEEIKIAQKETLGGKAFASSLSEMAQRVRSNVLQRTIRLLIQGMKAGGELPQILQGIGEDIRQMRLLQKEMAANTMSYTMFILFGMILGAPLLFSVSIQFVDILNKFQPEEMDTDTLTSMSASPAMGGMSGFSMMASGSSCPKDFDGDGLPDSWEMEIGLNPKNASDAHSVNPASHDEKTYYQEYMASAESELPSACVSSGYLTSFALIALSSIAFFGSLLVGLIREGKQSAGIKYMPLIVPATLGMFLIMLEGMSMFFGSMFVV